MARRVGANFNPWLGVPVIIAATWALSAQTPGASADIQQRLSVLESMIKRGPGNSTRVVGPLTVVGADGKVVLHVGPNRDPSAPVTIFRRPDNMGGVVSLNAGGLARSVIGVEEDGVGVVSALDGRETTRAQMNGRGAVIVRDEQGEQLAGLTRGEGGGRIAIWRGDHRVVDLISDPSKGGAGVLRLATSSGQRLAEIGPDPDFGDGGAVRVMSGAGRTTATLVGGLRGAGAVVVASGAGRPAAEMSLSSEGRGLVQVYGPGQRPVALLTQVPETLGGMLQLSNTTGPVVNLMAGRGGAGYLQLTDESHQPTVEAGTADMGRGAVGMVRVGPFYKCAPIKPSTPVIAVPGYEDCLVGSRGK